MVGDDLRGRSIATRSPEEAQDILDRYFDAYEAGFERTRGTRYGLRPLLPDRRRCD